MFYVAEVLFKLFPFGLGNGEILFACKVADGHIVGDEGKVVFTHYRAADTAANAGRHLDEALVHDAAFDITESCHAVLNSVDCHISVFGVALGHGFKYTAGGGEEASSAFLLFVGGTLDFNIGFSEPVVKLLEGEHGVNDAAVILGLVLLCNTRADEDGLCVRDTLFNILTVCLHWRHNVGKILQGGRVFLLNKKVYGVTAGGNDNITSVLSEHTLVLFFYNGCADGGLLHRVEAELCKSLGHSADACAVIVGYEGRGKAHNHGRTRLEHNAHLLGLVNDLLRILWALVNALAAEDTLVSDDMRLVTREAYGLNRALTHTAEAGLAV